MESIEPIRWLAGEAMPNTVLILSHREIRDRKRFMLAWEACEHRAVLDGGACVLQKLDDTLRPDFIIGDLDSITADTREFYEQRNVDVVYKPSQYNTDLGKAIIEAKERWSQTSQFLVFGGLGGRVDHSAHSILSCIRAQKQYDVRLILESDESVSFVVRSAANVVTPMRLLSSRPAVGIIPLMGSTKITTKGLTWDITDWETSFETQVSTSNYLAADNVTVETTAPVLFTLEA